MTMGVVLLTRERRFWRRGRALRVYVDNVKVGSVSNGSQLLFHILPGLRTIKINPPWWNRQPLWSPGYSVVVNVQAGYISAIRCWGIYSGFVIVDEGNSTQDVRVEFDSNSHQSVNLLSELDVNEYNSVYHVEEYPMDNTKGTEVLSSEIELSKRLEVELTVGWDSQTTLGTNASVLSIVRAELSKKLSESTGLNVGQSISRRQSIKLSVKPGRSVTHKVTWKRHIRAGKYVVAIGEQKIGIPYAMQGDLTYEVEAC